MKKLLICLFMCIMCFSFVGCSKDETIDDNNYQQNNVQDSVDNQNDEDDFELEVGKYIIEKENDLILVKLNSGDFVTVTEYKFDKGIFDSARIIQTFSTYSLALLTYEQLKSDPTISEQYKDIDLSDNTITLIFSDEILSGYKDMNQDTLYDSIKETYENIN